MAYFDNSDLPKLNQRGGLLGAGLYMPDPATQLKRMQDVAEAPGLKAKKERITKAKEIERKTKEARKAAKAEAEAELKRMAALEKQSEDKSKAGFLQQRAGMYEPKQWFSLAAQFFDSQSPAEALEKFTEQNTDYDANTIAQMKLQWERQAHAEKMDIEKWKFGTKAKLTEAKTRLKNFAIELIDKKRNDPKNFTQADEEILRALIGQGIPYMETILIGKKPSGLLPANEKEGVSVFDTEPKSFDASGDKEII